MKKLFLTGLAVVALATPVMAEDVDTKELAEKLALASQYSQIVPVDEEISQAISNMVVQVPKDDRILFKSILERNIKAAQLKTVSEMALAEIFTKDELKALVAFYSTQEGQAIRKKMPEYQARLEPTLKQMVGDAIEAYQRQQ